MRFICRQLLFDVYLGVFSFGFYKKYLEIIDYDFSRAPEMQVSSEFACVVEQICSRQIRNPLAVGVSKFHCCSSKNVSFLGEHISSHLEGPQLCVKYFVMQNILFVVFSTV